MTLLNFSVDKDIDYSIVFIYLSYLIQVFINQNWVVAYRKTQIIYTYKLHLRK